MADQYYIDSRATGANNGSKNDGTVDANGIVIDAWQSIDAADAAAVILANDGPDMNISEGSGPYYEILRLVGNGANWYGNGVEVNGGVNLNNSLYKWTASGTSGEYYCELLAGGNPSLIEPKAGTVGGHYQGSSSDDADRQRGTPGSLTFDKQFGWGDADTLGYSTVYVKSAFLPNLYSEITMAQMDYNVNEAWTTNTFHDIEFSHANVANIRAYETYEFYKCAFKYPDFTCVTLPGNRNLLVLDSCNGYWGGHRFIFMENINCDAIVTNCTVYESHLFALFSASCDGTTSLTLKNNIMVGGEAGAIDLKSATAVLVETNNAWYPRMTATNGQLGYVSTANWATTDATDIPPSMATTTSSQSSLTDLLFTISNDAYNKSEFELIANSPCIGAGTDLSATMASDRVGINGEPYSNIDTDMGAAQSALNPLHPTRL